MRFLTVLAGISLCLSPAMAQEGEAPPFECDNNFGACGTPEMSGGGGGGGGGSVLIAFTDLGDTYQNADDFDDDFRPPRGVNRYGMDICVHTDMIKQCSSVTSTSFIR